MSSSLNGLLGSEGQLERRGSWGLLRGVHLVTNPLLCGFPAVLPGHGEESSFLPSSSAVSCLTSGLKELSDHGLKPLNHNLD